MKHAIRIATICLSLLGSTASPASAQTDGEPITIGTWKSIESKILGETRHMLIATPRGYEDSDDHYPVLYLLDGDSHFTHTVGLLEHKRSIGEMPPVIVVGITNTDRARDLTPPSAEVDPMAPTGGGIENFIAFMRDELMPDVQENYRANEYDIFVGHSFGGLAVVHTLVHHPDLFNAYLAISPSLWWDDQSLVKQAEEFFENTKSLDRTLYVTLGDEDSTMRGGVLKLQAALTEHAPDDFEWDSKIMTDETHSSVPYRSTLQGIEFIFKSWAFRKPLESYDNGGIAAIHEHHRAAGERFGVPNDTPLLAFLMTAFKLSEAGRFDEAIAVMEHDPERYPPPSFAYSGIAEQAAQQDEPDRAIEYYSKAVKVNPSDVGARAALTKLGVDPDSIATAIEVSEETLASYVGDYTVSIDGKEQTLRITLSEGAFSITIPLEGELALTPLADDRFAFPQGYAEAEFMFDRVGRVTTMLIRIIDGTELFCNRVND